MSIVACRSSPTTMRTGGAPCKPRAATSQPTSASTRCRAAASAVKLAIIPPVTNPTDAAGGSPSRSSDPAARDLFDHRGRGRGRVQAGVVVPTARQPVGRERGRVAAADDEPEVARSRDAQQPGCGRGPRGRMTTVSLAVAVSGVGPPSAVRSSSSVADACTGPVSNSARCFATSSLTLASRSPSSLRDDPTRHLHLRSTVPLRTGVTSPGGASVRRSPRSVRGRRRCPARGSRTPSRRGT